MAMSEERLVEMFRKLPEQEQNLTIDFIELLANRHTQDHLKVEADNSPLTDKEKKDIELAEQDIANGELKDWEDIQRELGL